MRLTALAAAICLASPVAAEPCRDLLRLIDASNEAVQAGSARLTRVMLLQTVEGTASAQNLDDMRQVTAALTDLAKTVASVATDTDCRR